MATGQAISVMALINANLLPYTVVNHIRRGRFLSDDHRFFCGSLIFDSFGKTIPPNSSKSFRCQWHGATCRIASAIVWRFQAEKRIYIPVRIAHPRIRIVKIAQTPASSLWRIFSFLRSRYPSRNPRPIPAAIPPPCPQLLITGTRKQKIKRIITQIPICL